MSDAGTERSPWRSWWTAPRRAPKPAGRCAERPAEPPPDGRRPSSRRWSPAEGPPPSVAPSGSRRTSTCTATTARSRRRGGARLHRGDRHGAHERGDTRRLLGRALGAEPARRHRWFQARLPDDPAPTRPAGAGSSAGRPGPVRASDPRVALQLGRTGLTAAATLLSAAPATTRRGPGLSRRCPC